MAAKGRHPATTVDLYGLTSPTSQRAVGVPLGRLGQPTDVASIVSFLAGPDSTFVTGMSAAAQFQFSSVDCICCRTNHHSRRRHPLRLDDRPRSRGGHVQAQFHQARTRNVHCTLLQTSSKVGPTECYTQARHPQSHRHHQPICLQRRRQYSSPATRRELLAS